MSGEFEVSFHRDLSVANQMIAFVFQRTIDLMSEFARQFNLHFQTHRHSVESPRRVTVFSCRFLIGFER